MAKLAGGIDDRVLGLLSSQVYFTEDAQRRKLPYALYA